MSPKRIITIGFELASSDTKYESFRSKISLLDWDIILFKPQISEFTSNSEYYKGKPSLSDSTSFALKESCEHWRREIKQAFDTGKTIIIFLTSLEEIYVDTGSRSYSGTGRNRQATRLVAEYNNYESVPESLAPVNTTGSSMKLSTRGSEVLAPYWTEFESVSQYKVILNGPKVPACIITRTGDKSVGALYRSNSSAGTLLMLPDIDFYSDKFVKEKDGKSTWKPAAGQFAERMVSTVVSLDKTLRSASEVTPEPAWVTDPLFALGTEIALRSQLLEAEQKVEQAQKTKEKLAEDLHFAGLYRNLLFEKGKLLENIIIVSLRICGFSASPFKESDSEFDVVFESSEGRLIGEAEGKDNKAVNIDKLRQLSMNIHEDLQRENVTTPAKPVLFGNGFRLQPLKERGDPFTEKCQSAAGTTSTALVFTPDLFWPVQYLLGNADQEYAKACRMAILSSTGRVTFPSPPVVDNKSDETPPEKAI